MRSPWWLAAALAYNIAGGPVHDFLATVLGAAADRVADRIRHGRRAHGPGGPAGHQDPVTRPPQGLEPPGSNRPPAARRQTSGKAALIGVGRQGLMRTYRCEGAELNQYKSVVVNLSMDARRNHTCFECLN
jgi:hypothetical protein